MSTKNFEHGNRIGIVYTYFQNYLFKMPIGRLSIGVNVNLPDGGEPISPGISFLLNQNLKNLDQDIHGPPDIVIEFLTESSTSENFDAYAKRLLENGVQEFWIFDLRDKTMQVWFNQRENWIKMDGKKLKSDLLPDFSLTYRKVFSK